MRSPYLVSGKLQTQKTRRAQRKACLRNSASSAPSAFPILLVPGVRCFASGCRENLDWEGLLV